MEENHHFYHYHHDISHSYLIFCPDPQNDLPVVNILRVGSVDNKQFSMYTI